MEVGSAAHHLAAELAAEHVIRLQDEGLTRVHLYTLNRSDLALEVCRRVAGPEPTGPGGHDAGALLAPGVV